jgi:DNA invertase Pin-like site-specific DNA recombinase
MRPAAERLDLFDPPAPLTGDDAENGEQSSFAFRHLDEVLREDRTLLAVTYMRVSTHEQRKKGNLKYRDRFLLSQLERLGINCVASYTEVGSGRNLNRPVFEKAVKHARTLQRQNPNALVVIVTDTRNRFLRNPHFNGSSDPLTHLQMRKLIAFTAGVTLVTVLPPHASHRDVKSHEAKFSTALGVESGKKVGRPPKKRRDKASRRQGQQERLRLSWEAIRMFVDEDASKRAISRKLGVPESTIRSWLKW